MTRMQRDGTRRDRAKRELWGRNERATGRSDGKRQHVGVPKGTSRKRPAGRYQRSAIATAYPPVLCLAAADCLYLQSGSQASCIGSCPICSHSHSTVLLSPLCCPIPLRRHHHCRSLLPSYRPQIAILTYPLTQLLLVLPLHTII